VLDSTTLSDSRVVKQLEQFVPVKIDADKDRTVVREFSVRSFPTILFLTPKGKRIGKINYLPPEQFADKLQETITIHRELSAMTARFKADPTDLETGGKVAAAYASRGQFIEARNVIKKLEAADPDNNTGHLTDAYLAMGEYYVDLPEPKYANAIRWYEKAVEQGHDSAAVAEARYRIGLARFGGRSKHQPGTERFGKAVAAAKETIEGVLAISDVPDDVRQRAAELMRQIQGELARQERLRSKD